MKINFLKPKQLLVASIIAGGGLMSSCSQEEGGERLYESFDPSKAQEQMPAQGIRGAIEHYSAVRGDIETGDVNSYQAYEALQHVTNNMPRAKNVGTEWTEVGPDNIGGRTRAFAIDIDDPNRLYAGAVSGGFWISENRGRSWQKVGGTRDEDESLQNMAISYIEQTSDGTIYFGTGEQNFTRATDGFGNSGVIGMGMWKSEDKGRTFQHLESTRPTLEDEPGHDANHAWDNVNIIKSDPDNPERIFAGTDNGLQVSEDGGVSWQGAQVQGNTQGISSDIRVSPDGETVFFVLHNQGMSNATLYRSTERGEVGTFEEVGDGLARGSSRMIVAIAPSNPDYVYISNAKPSSADLPFGLEAVYQSTDNGETFESIGDGDEFFDPMRNYGLPQGQGDYDNIIAVDPYDEERIFLGGVHYWKWSESNGWDQIAGLFHADQVNEHFVHADKHAIKFDTTRDPYIKYITTDGGITHSRDAQNKRYPTYSTLNRGYATVQFYAIAASYTGDLIGGAQDNSNIRVDGSGDTGKSGEFISGGDGAFTEISRIDPSVYIYETQYGNLRRSPDRGATAQDFWGDEDISGNIEACDRNNCPFVTPFRLWEDLTDSNSMLFFGKYNEIWVNKDPVEFAVEPQWFQISDDNVMGNFEPRYMAYSEDGSTLYVAGDNRGSTGQVYRISGINYDSLEYDEDGNFDPAEHDIETELIFEENGQRAVGLDLDFKDEDRLIITMGNYGNEEYIHLTENAQDSAHNVTFESIHGNMPRIPVYDATFGTNDDVILATEFGIFATDFLDGNNTNWSEENEGMERVPTYMLRRVFDFDPEVHTEEQETFRIYAGTHGRGAFVTNQYSEVPYTVSVDDYDEEFDEAFEMTLYPNPAQDHVNFEFEIAQNDVIKVNIYNLSGTRIESKDLDDVSSGLHNFEINTEDFNEGIYIMNLIGDNVESSEKFMIKR